MKTTLKDSMKMYRIPAGIVEYMRKEWECRRHTIRQGDVEVPSHDHRLPNPKNERAHERHLGNLAHGHVL